MDSEVPFLISPIYTELSRTNLLVPNTSIKKIAGSKYWTTSWCMQIQLQ